MTHHRLIAYYWLSFLQSGYYGDEGGASYPPKPLFESQPRHHFSSPPLNAPFQPRPPEGPPHVPFHPHPPGGSPPKVPFQPRPPGGSPPKVPFQPCPPGGSPPFQPHPPADALQKPRPLFESPFPTQLPNQLNERHPVFNATPTNYNQQPQPPYSNRIPSFRPHPPGMLPNHPGNQKAPQASSDVSMCDLSSPRPPYRGEPPGPHQPNRGDPPGPRPPFVPPNHPPTNHRPEQYQTSTDVSMCDLNSPRPPHGGGEPPRPHPPLLPPPGNQRPPLPPSAQYSTSNEVSMCDLNSPRPPYRGEPPREPNMRSHEHGPRFGGVATGGSSTQAEADHVYGSSHGGPERQGPGSQRVSQEHVHVDDFGSRPGGEERQQAFRASNHPPTFAAETESHPPAFAARNESCPPAFATGSESQPPTFVAEDECRPPAFVPDSESRPPAFAAGIEDAEEEAGRLKSSGHFGEDKLHSGRPGDRGRPNLRDSQDELYSGHPGDQGRPNFRESQDELYSGRPGVDSGHSDFSRSQARPFSGRPSDDDGHRDFRQDEHYSRQDGSFEQYQNHMPEGYTDFGHSQDTRFSRDGNRSDFRDDPHSGRPDFRNSPRSGHLDFSNDPHLGQSDFHFSRDDRYQGHSEYEDRPYLGRPDFRPHTPPPGPLREDGRRGSNRGGFYDDSGGRYRDEMHDGWREDQGFNAPERPYLLGK